jgi:hypothetical protein
LRLDAKRLRDPLPEAGINPEMPAELFQGAPRGGGGAADWLTAYSNARMLWTLAPVRWLA